MSVVAFCLFFTSQEINIKQSPNATKLLEDFFGPEDIQWAKEAPGGLLEGSSVGERSRNSKFSYESPRSIYGENSNEREGSASTYPCRSLSGSVQVNGVDGVVLVVIQITDDPSAERTAPPFQHTYSPVMSPTP